MHKDLGNVTNSQSWPSEIPIQKGKNLQPPRSTQITENSHYQNEHFRAYNRVGQIACG